MTATPMISDQWPRFVLPIVRKEWYQQMQEITSTAAQFYGVDTSTSSVEYSQGIGQFGDVPEYNASTAEGDPAAIPYDSFGKLYEKTFTHKEYAKGVAIERKLWDDDQKGNIRRRAANLGNSFGSTIATHQSSVFVNAFDATVVGSDAVALCSAVHPNREDDATTYHDNLGSSALSYDAVVETLEAGRRMDNDRGKPLPSRYNVLYVPIELQATAVEIVNALAKPGGANNDANFLSSQGLQVVVDDYLTDANNWFMVDSRQANLHLLWFWRVRPGITVDPSSDYNLVAKYRGYMRFSYGWDDFRFIFGHEVT